MRGDSRLAHPKSGGRDDQYQRGLEPPVHTGGERSLHLRCGSSAGALTHREYPPAASRARRCRRHAEPIHLRGGDFFHLGGGRGNGFTTRHHRDFPVCISANGCIRTNQSSEGTLLQKISPSVCPHRLCDAYFTFLNDSFFPNRRDTKWITTGFTISSSSGNYPKRFLAPLFF